MNMKKIIDWIFMKDLKKLYDDETITFLVWIDLSDKRFWGIWGTILILLFIWLLIIILLGD